MEIIRLDRTPSTFQITEGSVVPKPKSVMWIERHTRPGEFRFKSELGSGLQAALPTGSLVTHQDTLEVMEVEDHNIVENEDDGTPEIVVTGRSVTKIADERVIGTTELINSGNNQVVEILVPSGTAAEQAQYLLDRALLSGTAPADDAVAGYASTLVTNGEDVQSAQAVRRGKLGNVFRNYLDVDEFGVRTVRPHEFSSIYTPSTDLTFYIHGGVNRSSEVSFSYQYGELDGAEYFWTTRTERTAALVVGRWLQVYVEGSATGSSRKVELVEASDLDDQYDAYPTGSDATDILAKMSERGLRTLESLNQAQIASVDISDSARFKYRKHYNLGDLVSVEGNYGATAIMRVTEYVESEDETGVSSYPTLKLPKS